MWFVRRSARFNPHPSVQTDAMSTVYPIVDGDVKWLLSVQHVERFVGDACAFAFNTASVGGVFLTHHAAIHAAPAPLALEVSVRFTGSVIIVEALFRVSFAVDTPAYSHHCFALLSAGSFILPAVLEEGRTTRKGRCF